jgi:hypothetical protein
MLLLVTGASGVGKTTVRLRLASELDDAFELVELAHFGPIPHAVTLSWRQQTVEKAVRRAIELRAEGRHLLMAGDPVPAGEVLAAPSADGIDVAVCLLDADRESQSARLSKRGDPPALLENHVGFADWMRAHATDPSFVPEAITTNGWEAMRWERWVGRSATLLWGMTVLDTSGNDPETTAGLVAEWARKAIKGEAPVFRAGWYD